MPDPGASDSGFHFYGDYLRCQQYFAWRYHFDVQPLWVSPALPYGNSIHAGLEEWYKLLRDGETTARRYKAATIAFEKRMEEMSPQYKYRNTFIEDLARGQTTLEEYALNYPIEMWRVIAVEDTYSVDLPTGDKFTGRIDLVVETSQKRRYIVDHKTTGWGLASLIRTLNPSDQATGYLWLWNENFLDQKADGVLFNIIRNYKGKTDFAQHIVMKSDEDIERFKNSVTYIYDEIAGKIADPEEIWVRDTGACYKYNRECPYMDLCAGANFKSLIGTLYRRGEEQQ